MNKNKAKQEAVNRALNITDVYLDTKVLQLCKDYGYGAVMDSAARQWTLKDSMGAFYIGGCLGIENII